MQLVFWLSVPTAFLILSLAVLLNFMADVKSVPVKTYKRSSVDTVTMYLVLGLMYACFVLSFKPAFEWLRFQPALVLQALGFVLVVLGVGVNLAGRLALKAQWSNMIRIREDHQVIETGVYHYIRHPLYASTLWVILGASLIYGNWGILTLEVAVFYPMMIYRAKQEESALLKLEGYSIYMNRTGRFFPKLFPRRQR